MVTVFTLRNAVLTVGSHHDTTRVATLAVCALAAGVVASTTIVD